MNVPFPIWNVVLVEVPLIAPELLLFSVTDHVFVLGMPLSLNVAVHNVCWNATVTVDGAAPFTVTLPTPVPGVTSEYPATAVYV